MKINVYSIEKSKSEGVELLVEEYRKMIKKFAKIDDIVVFNKTIASAQTKGEIEAKRAYSKVYEPFLKGYSISLDVCGEELDSFEFSKLLENSSQVNFFIGGAYGFEESFLKKTHRTVSLSRLTYAHKIAKAVLFEQIYRGLCIKQNHPYHK